MLGLARRAAGSALRSATGLGRTQELLRQAAPPAAAARLDARRGYRHWWRVLPEDFELNTESMPKDVKTLMASKPEDLGFIDSYWYWRIRAESTIMDPENLPKKSYQQLCRDMGLTIVNEKAEHILGIIELYEYLKSSPFIGPFGTIENPVLVPAIHTERVVGCSGGTGDSEHVPLWFRCREGFLYRCGECDQIFMLVRVMYELPEEGAEINPIDPDVKDVYDFSLLEKGNEVWNSGGMVNWPVGYALAYLEVRSREGKEYLADMAFCQAYAFENRRFMMRAFARVLQLETGREAVWSKMVNIHHNYCECEQCRYYDRTSDSWREEKLWVTRKGATSAKKGQLGIIPGSMGTGSYIVRGKGAPDSWQSCSHGAGRSMSRASAFRSISKEAFMRHMRERGIVWDSRFADKVKDEAPMAYKDLGQVMQNQEDLVEVVHHLQPLINMKGF